MMTFRPRFRALGIVLSALACLPTAAQEPEDLDAMEEKFQQRLNNAHLPVIREYLWALRELREDLMDEGKEEFANAVDQERKKIFREVYERMGDEFSLEGEDGEDSGGPPRPVKPPGISRGAGSITDNPDTGAPSGAIKPYEGPGIRLHAKDAKRQGEFLEVNELGALSGWKDGSASWEIALEPGEHEAIFDYACDPGDGGGTLLATIGTGGDSKPIAYAYMELDPAKIGTGGWRVFSTKIDWQINLEQGGPGLVLSLRAVNVEGDDLMHLRSVTLRKPGDGGEIKPDPVVGAGEVTFIDWFTPDNGDGAKVRFEKKGPFWFESHDGEFFAKFKEVQRTGEFVELHDENRDIWVRLGESRAAWSRDREEWTQIPGGSARHPEPVDPTEPVIRGSRAYFGGNAYQMISDQVSWDEAAEYCEDADGSLVVIESPEEFQFLFDWMGERRYWIGARHSEDGWDWLNGDEVVTHDGVRPRYDKIANGVFLTQKGNDWMNSRGTASDEIAFYVCEWPDIQPPPPGPPMRGRGEGGENRTPGMRGAGTESYGPPEVRELLVGEWTVSGEENLKMSFDEEGAVSFPALGLTGKWRQAGKSIQIHWGESAWTRLHQTGDGFKGISSDGNPISLSR